jgi:hypothetical protein
VSFNCAYYRLGLLVRQSASLFVVPIILFNKLLLTLMWQFCIFVYRNPFAALAFYYLHQNRSPGHNPRCIDNIAFVSPVAVAAVIAAVEVVGTAGYPSIRTIMWFFCIEV